MVESYKNKSRLYTAIAAIITIFATMGVSEWQGIIPQEYWGVIPAIIAVLGFLLAQITEEKRVVTAEELVHESYSTESDDETA